MSTQNLLSKSFSLYDYLRPPYFPDTSVENIKVHPDAVKGLFSCPICLELLQKTMTTSCLHRFCKCCIYKALSDNKKMCPVCRKEIFRRQLRVDDAFDGMIGLFYPKEEVEDAVNAEKKTQPESLAEPNDLKVSISAIPNTITGHLDPSYGLVRWIQVSPSTTIAQIAKHLRMRQTMENDGEMAEESTINAPFTYPFTIFYLKSVIADRRVYIPMVATEKLGDIATKYKVLTSDGKPVAAKELALFFTYEMKVPKNNETNF